MALLKLRIGETEESSMMAAVEDSERRIWSCGPHANYCWGREVSEEVWRGVWNWGELKKGLLKLNIGMGIGMGFVTLSRAGNYTRMTYILYLISTRATTKFMLLELTAA